MYLNCPLSPQIQEHRKKAPHGFLGNLPRTNTIYLDALSGELVAKGLCQLNDAAFGARIGRHVVHAAVRCD